MYACDSIYFLSSLFEFKQFNKINEFLVFSFLFIVRFKFKNK